MLPQNNTTTDSNPNQLSALRQVTATEPPPTTKIRIATANGSNVISVLSDYGADISAAGPQLLTLLDEHPLNLLPSLVSPHTAAGHKMTPIGKLPTILSLQGRQHHEEMISWKAAQDKTACQLCQDHLPSNPKEPIVSKPKPLRPFQEVAVDFCTYGGKQFLIIVDCYTDWPDIIPMGTNTATHHLITALHSIFCRTAIPDILWSDGGLQFSAKAFQMFATQWGFTHQKSSPRYPQSSGKVEATVKSMKKILAASWNNRQLNDNKLCRALPQYHNTPSRKDGLSPAQNLYGHPIQDTLPAHRRSFSPDWQRSSQEVD